MKKDIDIVDALLDALNVHQEIPPSVRLMMNEAACTIINLRQAQFYDQCRLSALEDYLEMRGLHPRDFGNPFKSGQVERAKEAV